MVFMRVVGDSPGLDCLRRFVRATLDARDDQERGAIATEEKDSQAAAAGGGGGGGGGAALLGPVGPVPVVPGLRSGDAAPPREAEPYVTVSLRCPLLLLRCCCCCCCCCCYARLLPRPRARAPAPAATTLSLAAPPLLTPPPP